MDLINRTEYSIILDEIIKKSRGDSFLALSYLRDMLYDPKKINTVKIITCKDCKHFTAVKNSFFEDGTAIHYCSSDFGLCEWIKENDFCSYAERKNDLEGLEHDEKN